MRVECEIRSAALIQGFCNVKGEELMCIVRQCRTHNLVLAGLAGHSDLVGFLLTGECINIQKFTRLRGDTDLRIKFAGIRVRGDTPLFLAVDIQLHIPAGRCIARQFDQSIAVRTEIGDLSG